MGGKLGQDKLGQFKLGAAFQAPSVPPVSLAAIALKVYRPISMGPF
jgi:hypothetical protein